MADFHAADLWVAVVPDVSKVGPAMEQAGKDAKGKFGGSVKGFGKSILDELQAAKDKSKDVFANAGKDISDEFKKAGKTASGHMSEEFKKGAKDLGKVMLEQYGPMIGEELGKAIGGKIGDALHDIPGMDAVRDVMDQVAEHAPAAAQALQGVQNALSAIKQGNLGGALDELPGVLKGLEDLGVSKDFTSGIQGMADTIGKLAGPIKDIASGDKVTKIKGVADGFALMAPAIKDLTGVDLSSTVTHFQEIAATAETIGAVAEGFSALKVATVALGGGEVIAALGAFAAAAAPLAAIAATLVALNAAYDYARSHIQADMSNPQNNPFLPNTPVIPPGAPNAGGPVPGTAPDYSKGHIAQPGEPGTIPGQWVPPRRAGGGPLNGPGAIGKDSILMLGAPGEHVWTAGEVAGAGGHAAVHGLRSMASAGFFKNIRGYAGGGPVLQVIWDNPVTGVKIGEASGQMVGPGTSQPGYYNADWGGHTGHVHTSWQTGPDGEAYNLPKGSDIRQGASGFPPWVYRLASQYGLEASTYAGHQEKSGFNRGIDWWPKGHADMSGGSYTEDERNRLQRFASAMASLGTGATQGTGGGSVNYTAGGAAGSSGGAAGGTSGAAGTGGTGGAAGGTSGGSSGDTTQSQGQEFGGAMVTGALQALGLDGSVLKGFTGKGPMEWGATKLGMGILNWGLGTFGGGGVNTGGGFGGGLAGGALSALGVATSSGAGPAGGAGGGDTHNHFHGDFTGLQVNQTGQFPGSGMNDMNNAANSGAANRYMSLGMSDAMAAP